MKEVRPLRRIEVEPRGGRVIGSSFMQIAIDASRANIERKTGVARYAHNLLSELRNAARLSQGDRVVYYTREPLGAGVQELPQNFEERILGWPPKRLWTHCRLGFQIFLDKPDVLFIPAHVLPYQAPRYRGTKIVTTIHDVAFARFPETYSRSERIYQDWAVKRALKSAEFILVPSEWTRQELIALYGANPDQLVVTPLAHEEKRFHMRHKQEEQQNVLNRYGISRPFFLSLGRLEHKKNTKNIICAFLELRRQIEVPLNLVLVGEGGFGFEEIQPFLGLNGIKPLGWVDDDDLPILLSASAALIFPTRYEGFGIPILEAMACGVPVITSNYGANREVANGAAIMVDPDKEREITIAMLRLLTDPNLTQELIEKGFRRIQKFSWQKCAKITWEVLEYVGRL